MDNLNQLYDEMRSYGLEPGTLRPGMNRFPGDGKNSCNKAGWCNVFADRRGAVFGDWTSGLHVVWQAKRDKPYSPAERKAWNHCVSAAKALAEKERQSKWAEAQVTALAIWDTASDAPDDHPYLVRKGIKAHGARQVNGNLIIPIYVDGVLVSLQYISPNGDKLFLKDGRVKGGYYVIGSLEGASALCVCEGFATGASINKATGHPVAIAFNAGNLQSVALTVRDKFPYLPLVLCADNDVETSGNLGLTKANEAARAVNGLLAIPNFGDDRPDGMTDFNDMAKHRGLEAVAMCIREALPVAEVATVAVADPEEWPIPQPLTSKIEAEPYPLDAIPTVIRAAVIEVQQFTKAPIPLVASSAIGAVSLAVQAHVDVQRAKGLSGPVSLDLFILGDSGERKSTGDGYFIKPIREYEREQAEAAKPLIKDYMAASEAWAAKQGAFKDKIRQDAKGGKATEEAESALRDLEHNKPMPPRVPRLIYLDATPEALKFELAKKWPSGGIVSADAGIVLGAHGMGKESVMRNLVTMNLLWDGADIATERRSTESFIVRGARLTVSLAVQESVLREFSAQSGKLARGTGFFARFLIAWPESTQGDRPFSEPPENWPALGEFHRRISAILANPVPIDEDGVLTPFMLSLTPEAKAAWIIYHDTIESQLKAGGELHDIRDVASKSADNAARLAALFHVMEHGVTGAVGLEAFEGAARIAAWHLNESRRFFGELALPSELADAARLDSWLIAYCDREHVHVVSRRTIQQYVTPVHLRKKVSLDEALQVLEDVGRVRLVNEEHRKDVYLNPHLLKKGKV